MIMIMTMMWLWRCFYFIYSIPVDNELSCLSAISYLRLNNTCCWHIFSYLCRWTILALAVLGAQTTRMWGGCWVGLCYAFYVLLYLWFIFKLLVLELWCELRWPFWYDMSIPCMYCLSLIVLFLFCRRNTLGHVGLTYFVLEFSMS